MNVPKVNKNSNNSSSKQPSSDDFKKKTKSLRTKSGKTQGAVYFDETGISIDKKCTSSV